MTFREEIEKLLLSVVPEIEAKAAAVAPDWMDAYESGDMLSTDLAAAANAAADAGVAGRYFKLDAPTMSRRRPKRRGVRRFCQTTPSSKPELPSYAPKGTTRIRRYHAG